MVSGVERARAAHRVAFQRLAMQDQCLTKIYHVWCVGVSGDALRVSSSPVLLDRFLDSEWEELTAFESDRHALAASGQKRLGIFVEHGFLAVTMPRLPCWLQLHFDVESKVGAHGV